MKFGGIGVPELVIILVVCLLIFGPKNLPKLGSALGKTVKNLRDGMSGAKQETEMVEESDEIDGEVVEAEEEERPKAKKASRKKAQAKEPVAETA